jgi:hypothetical protein
MIKKRKAQGLSVQSIVIFALAALVMVVLAVFFITRYSRSRQAVDYVQNEWEYKAACLARHQDDKDLYDKCVEQCKKAAENKQFLQQCKLKEK